MTLPAIPSIDGEITPQLRAILLAMKENIEVRGGQRKATDDDKFSTAADVTAAAAVAAIVASTAEAIAGTENTKQMTALRMREGFNAAGSAPVFACRAWVNFNGTGTVAIRASGNVSSITDNGVGDYTVNFTTAMLDANYASTIVGGEPANSTGYDVGNAGAIAPTAAAFRLGTRNSNTGVNLDLTYVHCTFFR